MSGQTASWFFGESLEPDSATLVLTHAARLRARSSASGRCPPTGSTRWGDAVPVATGANERRRAGCPDGARRRPGGAGASGRSPPQRVVITVAGRPYELGGSLSSAIVPGPWQLAGFSQGYAVFTLRKPPAPLSASTTGGRQLPVEVISSATKSEAIRVDAPAAATRHPLRGLGLRLEGHRLRQRGPAADDPGRVVRPRAARSTSRPGTTW